MPCMPYCHSHTGSHATITLLTLYNRARCSSDWLIVMPICLALTVPAWHWLIQCWYSSSTGRRSKKILNASQTTSWHTDGKIYKVWQLKTKNKLKTWKNMKQMEHKIEQACKQTQDIARRLTDPFSNKQVELTRAVTYKSRLQIRFDDMRLHQALKNLIMSSNPGLKTLN